MTEEKKRKKVPKKAPLRYFFYRGNLCKKVRINRGDDVIVAWNYTESRVERYLYSDVKKNGEHAYTTSEVLEFLNRADIRGIRKGWEAGLLERPQMTYDINSKKEHKYLWCEKDIMAAHEYLSGVHIGRPRQDGQVTSSNLPTAAELRAMIRRGTVLYVKVGDDFVPTWAAERF